MPRLSPPKRPRDLTKATTTIHPTDSPSSKNFLSPAFVDRLIGRDDEYKKLHDKIMFGLNENVSTTIYISGPAGTGKTLTANTVIEDLKSKNFHFKHINLNCMSFQNASDCYEKILSNLVHTKTKRSCTSQNSRIQTFNEIKELISKSKNMTILMLDEIDQLQTRNHDVLNNIFKLPILCPQKVLLIGIANALDFTAKMSWLKHEQANFHEVRFLPYTKEQIVQIIENRLKLATNNENILIDRNAIEFCARKIASSSGDIRKALDVCRRAIELIENQVPKMNNALSTTNYSPLKQRQNIDKIEISSTKHRSRKNLFPINDSPLKENNATTLIQKHVDTKLMMNALNKVYGNAVQKIELDSKIFLPSDQQVILSVFLIYLKIKSSREIKLSEFRELLMKICKRNGITSEGKTESDILDMCQYLADYGYVTVTRRDSTNLGSSPFKRTLSKSSSSPFTKAPQKRNFCSTSLQLLIDPNEAEQLISSFHKLIISDAHSYVF